MRRRRCGWWDGWDAYIEFYFSLLSLSLALSAVLLSRASFSPVLQRSRCRFWAAAVERERESFFARLLKCDIVTLRKTGGFRREKFFIRFAGLRLGNLFLSIALRALCSIYIHLLLLYIKYKDASLYISALMSGFCAPTYEEFNMDWPIRRGLCGWHFAYYVCSSKLPTEASAVFLVSERSRDDVTTRIILLNIVISPVTSVSIN